MHERKEIIQISGLSILVVMALVGDVVIAGSLYRWHEHEIYRIEKQHNAVMTEYLGEERRLKNIIIAHDGVTTWSETAYFRSQPVLK